jgi:hypothetical protein
MSDYAVTLPVPEEIYDRARQVAAGTAQSVEAVLLQQLQAAFMAPLPPLPPDEQRELEALTSLSDEALWTPAQCAESAGRCPAHRAGVPRDERGLGLGA